MPRPFRDSLKHALAGLVAAYHNQPNVRIHTIVAGLILIVALLAGKSALEIGLLVVTIAMVIVAELINTAIEMLADVMHPRLSKSVQILKDVSAAAVLVCSIAAVIIGMLLFYPVLGYN
ncbi:diacylglycerol kinase family protein [Candidatus Uhrbacteria bacterium]|nr:diacylglycerol kinase family protein [Candidatus Uhrbacteria bacterium]